MVLDNFRNIISIYSSIIADTEFTEYTETKTLAKLKSKIRLYDGSILYVREIYINQQLIDYSYYWFNIDEKLKIGWDNAPHHPEIYTFPHHKHFSDHIGESSEKSLIEVLKYIYEQPIF